jgi:hypothetical protein
MWDLHINRVISEDRAKEEHIDELWSQLTRLSADISYLKYEQSYQRARWLRNHDTAEATNGRVKFFALLRSGGIVAISLVQVFFIMRFFESKVSLNGLGGYRISGGAAGLFPTVGRSVSGRFS